MPALSLQRLPLFRRHREDAGTMTPLGVVIRFLILLAFGIFFGLPLLWLLLAPTKTDVQLSQGFPLSLGSLNKIGQDWQNLLAFDGGVIVQWSINSIVYTVSALILSLVITIPAGYALAAAQPHARKVILWVTLITMLLPISAMVLPLFLEINTVHLVNTPWSVILPTAFFPFGVYLAFVYYSVSLPRELSAAARLDGANEWQVFWHVGLPLSQPLLGLLAFLSFTANWNNYFLPFVMLQDTSVYNLAVGLQSLIAGTPALHPAMISDLPIHRAELALAGVVMALPVAIVFLFSQRYVISGALTGSLKD